MAELNLALLQEKVFSIFVEFDRICRKYDIKYSMEGGTLLGAVKYQDYVPWDDDIDVIMKRDEYEHFLKVAPKELDEKFFLQSYNNVSEFPLNYAKLCLNGTEIYDYEYSHLKKMHHGIFMDIFPIDNVTRRGVKRQCLLTGAFTAVRRLKLKLGSLRGAKLIIYKVLSILPLTFLIKIEQYLCTLNNNKKTEFRYEVCNPNKNFRAMPFDLYEEYTELTFRNKKFLAVKEYDDFLKSRFGKNYMEELPPPEKRKPSHSTNIVFDR